MIISAHFASPMYSPFSASPSPSNPQHYRAQQLNGPDNLTSNAAGLTMPSYNSLTVSSSVSYFTLVLPIFIVIYLLCGRDWYIVKFALVLAYMMYCSDLRD